MLTVDQQIRAIAAKYAADLQTRVQERVIEMASDDKSHYLIYRILGVTLDEGEAIDIFQNKGRFLYRYAGTFLEHATRLCLETKFPGAGPRRIANPAGSRPKNFEIDCVINKRAYEIKWRDATTDGDHITKEHARILAVARAGFIPVRLMYYYPNRAQAMRIQAALKDLYKANNGEYYSGLAAWKHLEAVTDINLLSILEDIANGIANDK